MGWSRPRCLVGQFECFVGSVILVDIFCHFIPIFRRGIRRTSIGHHSNGVLDLPVQSFSEFHYSGFGVCIPCFCYQFYKLIQVVVNGPGLLVIIGRLQFIDGCDISMSQAEVLLEFFMEFFPVKEFQISFMLLFSQEYLLGPFSCLPRFQTVYQ